MPDYLHAEDIAPAAADIYAGAPAPAQRDALRYFAFAAILMRYFDVFTASR